MHARGATHGLIRRALSVGMGHRRSCSTTGGSTSGASQPAARRRWCRSADNACQQDPHRTHEVALTGSFRHHSHHCLSLLCVLTQCCAQRIHDAAARWRCTYICARISARAAKAIMHVARARRRCQRVAHLDSHSLQPSRDACCAARAAPSPAQTMWHTESHVRRQCRTSMLNRHAPSTSKLRTFPMSCLASASFGRRHGRAVEDDTEIHTGIDTALEKVLILV